MLRRRGEPMFFTSCPSSAWARPAVQEAAMRDVTEANLTEAERELCVLVLT
jgi:hypothetical protein